METTCKVTQLHFNDGTCLEIAPNDIVVFVGANNCGKSQALKDISKAFSDPSHNVVIKAINFWVSGRESFEENLKRISVLNSDSGFYAGYGYSIPIAALNHVRENSFSGLSFLSDFFVKQVSTRDRLSQCDPVGVIERDEPKRHPIHYLVYCPEIRERINKSFYEAFGDHLEIERTGGKTNYLRLGSIVGLLENGAHSVDDELDHLMAVLDTYPKLHEQGDGMVGFTGVLLSLVIENYSVFLIDEPESFLHPPQARILGAEIPELLGDRQAFIATHSEHLIKGLLDAATNRIKIVRISRTGEKNDFSVINAPDIVRIWKDTLLRQSNALQGLFYNTVVICESDSDCQFYSSIQAFQNEKAKKRDNPFYVYASTKARIKVLVEALKPLNVDFRVIADMDLLREKNDLVPLFEACGGKWDDLKDDYSLFKNALKDDDNTISKDDLKIAFMAAIDEDGKEEYDKKALMDLKRKVTLERKWEALKKEGCRALPKEAKGPYERIKDALLVRHIHLVPVGELEGFVCVGGHGPRWVANVFEKHPDFNDVVYDEVKAFIKEWGV